MKWSSFRGEGWWRALVGEGVVKRVVWGVGLC